MAEAVWDIVVVADPVTLATADPLPLQPPAWFRVGLTFYPAPYLLIDGFHGNHFISPNSLLLDDGQRFCLIGIAGLEPATYGLKIRCSTY